MESLIDQHFFVDDKLLRSPSFLLSQLHICLLLLGFAVKNLTALSFAILTVSIFVNSCLGEVQGRQPNILWIVTDDQRADSVRAFNRVVYGHNASPLGYVESPNIDRLAKEGVLFTQAFTNCPVCAPSRAAMHSGRYPFRSGHYAFELTHQAPDFVKPVVSEVMRDHGYNTASFGKMDHYIYQWGPGQGFHDAGLFDLRIHFKNHLQKNGWGDLFVKAKYDQLSGAPAIIGMTENVIYPSGKRKTYFLPWRNVNPTERDLAAREKVTREFDLLRAYTRQNTNLIIGGENPRPAGDTIDAYILREFTNYLDNADTSYETLWGQSVSGPNTSKPQFLHLGFHLPHTPVLPPKSYRDRFRRHNYEVPEFDQAELDKMPKQLRKIFRYGNMVDLADEEKQQAIQDYYAFCAYGDTLIGEAVEKFKAYCKSNNQEYLILYVIGDHGWHLGEQGIIAKTMPHRQSVSNAAILVSSDKSLVPEGGVYEELIEFVDFAPTFVTAAGVDVTQPEFDYLDGYPLLDVLSEKRPKRDYVLGEINVISGPRAFLHTERFRFSMRTRPFDNIVMADQIGKNLKWALKAPAEKVEMTLYDLERDPLERDNLAYQEGYQGLAAWFRDKLGRIVLGDGRIECDWSQENSYASGEFAKGADDKNIDIPYHLIPN